MKQVFSLRSLGVVLAYQIVPLVLIAMWLESDIFRFLGVDYSTDISWRRPAAGIVTLLLYESPLLLYFAVRYFRNRGQKVEGN